MNERIKELALQADGHFGDGLEFAVVFGELKDLEKFAQLIVRECANCVDFYTSDGNGPASDVILKHFGVEL